MKLITLTLLASVMACSAQINEQRLADAIYKAEGGKAAQYPYGIKAGRPLDASTARQWCLRTIRHQERRWEASGMRKDFIQFLSEIYCPIKDKSDIHHLNQYWTRNVRRFLNKG